MRKLLCTILITLLILEESIAPKGFVNLEDEKHYKEICHCLTLLNTFARKSIEKHTVKTWKLQFIRATHEFKISPTECSNFKNEIPKEMEIMTTALEQAIVHKEHTKVCL